MKDNQQTIPASRLHFSRSPLRPVRKDTVEYRELVQSIKKDGLLQPLLVRPVDGGDYEVVEGGHRLEAGKEAGLDSYPCLVKAYTDQEVMIIQLKCQAVRPQETRKFEYSRRLKKLLDDGMTIPELCNKIDKSPLWVKNILQLLRLCDDAAAPVDRGEITLKKAVALTKLPLELQPNFIDDAIAMPTEEFIARSREAKRDYDHYLTKGEFDDKMLGAHPRIRSGLQIIKEANSRRAAIEVLPAAEAKTPLDGWNACLAWVMRIDPLTLERKQKSISEGKDETIDLYTYRQMKRQMIRNLVTDTKNLEIDNE